MYNHSVTDSCSAVALCIDCDGTLIRSDLLHESILLMLKGAPWKLLMLPIWLARGKAYMKQRIAESVSFDWATIPVREEVLALVLAARESGRHTVLATASDVALAQGLADHLGVFEEVIASDGRINLSGRLKAEKLCQRFGARGFDYAGDSSIDLPVWAVSRRAVVVSASATLISAVSKLIEIEAIITPRRPRLSTYMRGLRLHQWIKNLLVFVPLVAAHQLSSLQGLAQGAIAFASFSLCASAVYVLNDLLDLDADRCHVRKCNRPFASALIPVSHGVALIPLLLLASLALAALLPIEFVLVLTFYFILTLSYSLLLKRQVIVDVLLLASLYTLRVIAGGAATAIFPSFWLLAFSMFLFLSLAMVKRYSELLITLQQRRSTAAGRGYVVEDLPQLMSIGTSSGMVAVLVFSLYINNPDIKTLYEQPLWLWLVPPLLLYWISRLWMKAQRGQVDDDPLVFALRDWQSVVVFLISGLCFLLA